MVSFNIFVLYLLLGTYFDPEKLFFFFFFFFFSRSAYPLVNPKIFNPCGHTVCGHCAERLEQNGSRNCHMCRQPRNGFCRNIFAEQLLAEEKVTYKGCNNDVPLPAIQQHVTVLCQKIEETCSQCQTSVKRSETQAHNQNK